MYLFIVWSGLSLTLKTHLHPIGFIMRWGSLKVQVLLAKKKSYSSYIAWCRPGWDKAYLKDWGSPCVRNVLGLKWLVLGLVNVRWPLMRKTPGCVELCMEGERYSSYQLVLERTCGGCRKCLVKSCTIMDTLRNSESSIRLRQLSRTAWVT